MEENKYHKKVMIAITFYEIMLLVESMCLNIRDKLITFVMCTSI
jgi:hypothetical protein